MNCKLTREKVNLSDYTSSINKEEEKTLFDVVLEDIPADKKVGIYKVIRGIANIPVNQIKEFTATLPKSIKEAISKEEAEAAKQQLEEAGAKVKIA